MDLTLWDPSPGRGSEDRALWRLHHLHTTKFDDLHTIVSVVVHVHPNLVGRSLHYLPSQYHTLSGPLVLPLKSGSVRVDGGPNGSGWRWVEWWRRADLITLPVFQTPRVRDQEELKTGFNPITIRIGFVYGLGLRLTFRGLMVSPSTLCLRVTAVGEGLGTAVGHRSVGARLSTAGEPRRGQQHWSVRRPFSSVGGTVVVDPEVYTPSGSNPYHNVGSPTSRKGLPTPTDPYPLDPSPDKKMRWEWGPRRGSGGGPTPIKP